MRYLLIILLLISCGFNDSEREGVDKAYSVDLALARSQRERVIIDSIADSWGWSDELLPGGIRYTRVISGEASNPIDTTVILNVSVDLINGNKCYSVDSTYVVVGKYPGIRAIDEIAIMIGEGDSVVALVPSDFGHGISGLPGFVPPGAMLKISVRQLARQEAQ